MYAFGSKPISGKTFEPVALCAFQLGILKYTISAIMRASCRPQNVPNVTKIS